MNEIKFTLPPEQEYIDLLQLLKATRLAQTGGHAKMIVDEGLVWVNGELEFRRRKKLYRGDFVKTNDISITLS